MDTLRAHQRWSVSLQVQWEMDDWVAGWELEDSVAQRSRGYRSQAQFQIPRKGCRRKAQQVEALLL